MTATKKTSNPAPLAHRVPAQVSQVITAYAEWLSAETGYKVDPMSVYLGSQLRSTFQKGEANQARLAEAAQARAVRDAEKAKARAEREAKATAPNRVATPIEHAADLTAQDVVHDVDPNKSNGCTCGQQFTTKGALTRHIRRHIVPLVQAEAVSE